MRAVAILGLSLALCQGSAASSAQGLKGNGPTGIATGYGAVWLGTGGGSVIRIDAQTSRIVQRIEVSFSSVQRLVAAYGSMWVATGTGLLKRIDPLTGRVHEISGRDQCTSASVALVAGTIWVLDFHHKRLCRVDPARNRIIRRVSVDEGEPLTLSLASDPSRLWLAANMEPKPAMVEDNLEQVRLIALDPHSGMQVGPAIDTAGWVGFSRAFGSLWAADPVAETLARIDPLSGRTSTLRLGVDSGVAPTGGFGSLWLPAGAALQRLDPDSLATVAEIPIRASAIAVGSGSIWVLNSGDGTRGTVTRVDPRTNRVVGGPLRVVPKP